MAGPASQAACASAASPDAPLGPGTQPCDTPRRAPLTQSARLTSPRLAASPPPASPDARRPAEDGLPLASPAKPRTRPPDRRRPRPRPPPLQNWQPPRPCGPPRCTLPSPPAAHCFRPRAPHARPPNSATRHSAHRASQRPIPRSPAGPPLPGPAPRHASNAPSNPLAAPPPPGPAPSPHLRQQRNRRRAVRASWPAPGGARALAPRCQLGCRNVCLVRPAALHLRVPMPGLPQLP